MARKRGDSVELPTGVFVWKPGRPTKDGKVHYGVRWAGADGKDCTEHAGPSLKGAQRLYWQRKDEVERERQARREGRRLDTDDSDVSHLFLASSQRYRSGAGANKSRPKEDEMYERLWLAALSAHFRVDGSKLGLQDISPADVEAIVARWRKAKMAEWTIYHRMQYLRRLYNVSIRDDVFSSMQAGRKPALTLNPLEYVDFPIDSEPPIHYLTIQQQDELRAKFDPRWWYFVVIAIFTGLRQSEQFGLLWTHVNFDAGFLEIPRSKHGRSREVPMHKIVADVLARLETRGRVPYVFPAPEGGLVHAKNFYNRVYVPAMEAAGLVEVRPRPDRKKKETEEERRARLDAPRDRREMNWNTLRHTTATRLVHAGVPLPVVQEIMGHRTIEMTRRYTKVYSDHRTAGIQRLELILPDDSSVKCAVRWKPEKMFEPGQEPGQAEWLNYAFPPQRG